jgi:hypothetical protein
MERRGKGTWRGGVWEKYRALQKSSIISEEHVASVFIVEEYA